MTTTQHTAQPGTVKPPLQIEPPKVNKWGWYRDKMHQRMFFVIDVQHDLQGNWTVVQYIEVGKLEPVGYPYAEFLRMVDAGNLIPFRMTVAQYIFLPTK